MLKAIQWLQRARCGLIRPVRGDVEADQQILTTYTMHETVEKRLQIAGSTVEQTCRYCALFRGQAQVEARCGRDFSPQRPRQVIAARTDQHLSQYSGQCANGWKDQSPADSSCHQGCSCGILRRTRACVE